MLGLLFTRGAIQPPKPVSTDCGSEPTVTAVLDQFRDHRLVLLGEQHQRKEFHEFLQSLIHDPRFLERVNDVVVEFGNARYQDVVDRYVAGADVSLSALRPAWRDTTQLLVWDSPMYEEFFRSIRELNQGAPAGRRLRVLLGDPPIDWSVVTDKASYGRFIERDETFAGVVEREVLARGRSALLVIGGEHVLRTPDGEALSAHPGLGDLLKKRNPPAAVAIFTVPAKRPLAGYANCYPLLLSASGEVGGRSFGDLVQPGIKVRRMVNGELKWVSMEAAEWPRVREKMDALLWLGPAETLVPAPPAVLKDRSYILELHRRARIMSDFFGFDLTEGLPPVPQG